jgi:hypothetical protein
MGVHALTTAWKAVPGYLPHGHQDRNRSKWFERITVFMVNSCASSSMISACFTWGTLVAQLVRLPSFGAPQERHCRQITAVKVTDFHSGSDKLNKISVEQRFRGYDRVRVHDDRSYVYKYMITEL